IKSRSMATGNKPTCPAITITRSCRTNIRSRTIRRACWKCRCTVLPGTSRNNLGANFMSQPAERVAPDGQAGLSEAVKQTVRDALQRVSARTGFVRRRSQRLMMGEVAKTQAGEYTTSVNGERIICVEGPTGTGKSLGYLLPAIPL